MSDQDIAVLDDTIVKLPSDIREDLARRASNDLFFMCKGVLGFTDMTVPCHGPLTTFIDRNPKRFKGILMPRDHYKSSVVTIGGTIQRVTANVESRNLIGNESATNAERFLRAIRQQFESNRVLRALYSSIIPDTRKVRWNDTELEFRRQGHYPEPTIDSIGMTGTVTSRHYTHITIDDPISEEAVKSEKVMQDTINRLSALPALLSKPEVDTFCLIGTRWAFHDVYSWHMKIYRDRMAWFIRGSIEDGEPIFPELMSLETLALKRETMGEYKFSCLMMNNPRNEDLQDLNVTDLCFWEWEADGEHIKMVDSNGATHRTIRLDQLDITATVDLAPAERMSSDRNAITVVGITPWDEAIVLEAWGSRCTPLELMEQIFTFQQKYHARIWGIEGVAYQKAFKYFLKQQCEHRGIHLRIEELSATGKKEIRIRGIQPVMATHRLYIRSTQHLLRNEMSDFPLGEHDDVLDSLSMHLQLWRGRMSPERWERLKKEENKLVARMMRDKRANPNNANRRITNFDVDEDDFDLPGPEPIIEDFVIA